MLILVTLHSGPILKTTVEVIIITVLIERGILRRKGIKISRLRLSNSFDLLNREFAVLICTIDSQSPHSVKGCSCVKIEFAVALDCKIIEEFIFSYKSDHTFGQLNFFFVLLTLRELGIVRLFILDYVILLKFGLVLECLKSISRSLSGNI